MSRVFLYFMGTITNEKVNPKLPKVPESCDRGVLEWWSLGISDFGLQISDRSN